MARHSEENLRSGKKRMEDQKQEGGKNAEVWEAEEKKERTGEFNQSKKVLQPEASSRELKKWTWAHPVARRRRDTK